MDAAPHWVTVFDIGNVSFNYWEWGVWFALIILVGGGFILARYKKPDDPTQDRGTAGAMIVLPLMMALLLMFVGEAHTRYRALQAALLRGRYDMVQGIVAMRWDGKRQYFDVGNAEFEYSRYEMQSVFNMTMAGGLPDIGGRTVRAAHVGRDIVRLQVWQ